MKRTDVLIVGAGPTGLVLALWLAKSGVKLRIVDKADKAGTTSRAVVIHARTLEFYHQLGVDKTAIDRGIEFTKLNLWVRAKQMGAVQFDNLGKNISPYQYSLILPQDLQEEMLIAELSKLGIDIERNTELLSFKQIAKGVEASLSGKGIIEQCEALYIAGCDGAHSTVRKQMNVEFAGGDYKDTFYVADLKINSALDNKQTHIALDKADFLIVFPLKSDGEVRLIGSIRDEVKNKENLEWKDVSEEIIRSLKMEVKEIKWFSSYKIHHRVASIFRQGNAFLLGDAGHIHSPVGGQGMNTGIGDAVNLAWKMAAVIKNSAPAEILDTYEVERMAFAQRLVASTDKAFEFVTARGFFAKQIRLHIIPHLLPVLFRLRVLRRLMFRIISQTSINYRQSDLSTGATGQINGGDRLPWVKMESKMIGGVEDNFQCLRSLQWQVHVYGDMTDTMQMICTAKGLKLHVFPWSLAAEKCGLVKNSVYVIRPDGYIGMIEPAGKPAEVTEYLNRWVKS